MYSSPRLLVCILCLLRAVQATAGWRPGKDQMTLTVVTCLSYNVVHKEVPADTRFMFTFTFTCPCLRDVGLTALQSCILTKSKVFLIFFFHELKVGFLLRWYLNQNGNTQSKLPALRASFTHSFSHQQ